MERSYNRNAITNKVSYSLYKKAIWLYIILLSIAQVVLALISYPFVGYPRPYCYLVSHCLATKRLETN